MERVLVVGSTGSGKTTLGRELGRRLGLPFVEIDVLLYRPGWTMSSTWVEDVERLAGSPAWVLDTLGRIEVRDALWSRADTVVWLDYPRRVVMSRIVRRSLRRTVTRERIFGGNRETLRGWLERDHPARWAWSQYERRRADIAALTADARFQPLRTLRFRSPAEARDWLAAVPSVS